ncbi:MAG: hypothetical protein K8L99_21000 [Anaerolineae bacterium]|nr:hypothetical protein [Anaerolineae bacterium]
MRKIGTLLVAMTVAAVVAQSPALAEDAAIKKVGGAIAWPFKKLGQGVKAAGNGAKKVFTRGK